MVRTIPNRLAALWHDYALGIVWAVAFLLTWAGQYLTGEGMPYANTFWNATLENWQSEFLQVGAFVVASAYWRYAGSPQSKDGDEEQQRLLRDIVSRLDRMERLDRADRNDRAMKNAKA